MNYSFIIPHYDIPHLLVRCLSSIPVHPDVQIIVVDDCSPCGIEAVQSAIDGLNRQDIELYSTEQGGSAGRARNVGLQHACGKWLLFADADDFFEDGLSSLLDRFLDRDEELIFFRTRCVMSDDIAQPASRSEWLNALWTDFDRTQDLQLLAGRCPVVWGRMVRRELVERHDIRFDETHYSNDYWFAANVAVYARSLAVEKENLYVVTARADSLASKMNQKAGEIEERAEVCFRVEQLLMLHGIQTKPFEPFDVYMHLLYDNPELRDLYYQYFRRMPLIGYSQVLALAQMCHGAGWRRKLSVWFNSYLHLFI